MPNLNVYGSVRGLYESGLQGLQLTESGELQPLSRPGMTLEGGAYGGWDWRRVSLGLDYRGDYRHLWNLPDEATKESLNGTNQVIAIDTTFRQSRRTTTHLSVAGGTTNRAFGAFAAPAFGDTTRPGVPLNEVFDVRTYFLQADAGFTHQFSARTSASAGLTAFFVKREGNSLINSQGYRAYGYLSRRLNRRTTVLGNYQWLSFQYPHLLANSFIHGISGGIEHQFSRQWSMIAVAGAYLVHSTGTQQVTLSPEVAEILGRSTADAFFDKSATAPLVDLRATYTQERGSFYVGVSSTVVPGNGVYLTSSRQTANGGYSYSGIRRVSLGVNGGYSQMKSRSLDLADSNYWQAGGGISYRLFRSTQLMGQYDRRIWKSSGVQARSGYAVTFGLAWNPSRVPIAIW
jgi:hypothetical protein